MEEKWAKCTENPAYEVSTLGRLRSLSGKINDRKPHATGYMRAYIKNVGIRPVHVLVAKAFIHNDSPQTKTIVNHIDGNRTNNNIDNLEWVTSKENRNKWTVTPVRTINKYKYTNLPGEIWKDVMFEGVSLKASSLGRVETSSGVKTYGGKTADGYLKIYIERGVPRQVHRIVCTAFHGQPASLDLVVNHKDYNRTNNVPTNLEWTTIRENNIHGIKNKSPVKAHNCRSVCQYSPDKSTLIATYDNISAAAKATGANRSAIVQMCRKWRGRTYDTIGGFYWEYDEK